MLMFDYHVHTVRCKHAEGAMEQYVQRAIETLRLLVHFDHLYIGGGNAKKLDFTPDPDVTIISNEAGIRGGVALWAD